MKAVDRYAVEIPREVPVREFHGVSSIFDSV